MSAEALALTDDVGVLSFNTFAREHAALKTCVANIVIGVVFAVWAMVDFTNDELSSTVQRIFIYTRLTTFVLMLLLCLLFLIPIIRTRLVYVTANLSYTVLLIGNCILTIALPLPSSTWLGFILVATYPALLLVPRNTLTFWYFLATLSVIPIDLIIAAAGKDSELLVKPVFYAYMFQIMFMIFAWAAMRVLLTIPIEESTRRKFLAHRKLIDEASRLKHLLSLLVPANAVERLLTTGEYSGADDGTVVIIDFECGDNTGGLRQVVGIVGQLSELGQLFGCRTVRATVTGVMLLAGNDSTSVTRAMQFAAVAMTAFKVLRDDLSGHLDSSVQIRVGVGIGRYHGGVIGVNRFRFDIWGPAVNRARRVVQKARDGVCSTDSVITRLAPDHMLLFTVTASGTAHVRPTTALLELWRDDVQSVFPCDISAYTAGLSDADDTGYGTRGADDETFDSASDMDAAPARTRVESHLTLRRDPTTSTAEVNTSLADYLVEPASRTQRFSWSDPSFRSVKRGDVLEFLQFEIQHNYRDYTNSMKYVSIFCFACVIPDLMLMWYRDVSDRRELALFSYFIASRISCALFLMVWAHLMGQISPGRARRAVLTTTLLCIPPMVVHLMFMASTLIVTLQLLDVDPGADWNGGEIQTLHNVISTVVPMYILASTAGQPSLVFAITCIGMPVALAVGAVILTSLSAGYTLNVIASAALVGGILTLFQRVDQVRSWHLTRLALDQTRRTTLMASHAAPGLVNFMTHTEPAPAPRATVVTRAVSVFACSFNRVNSYVDHTAADRVALINVVHRVLDDFVMKSDILEKLPSRRDEYMVVAGVRQLLSPAETAEEMAQFVLVVQDTFDRLTEDGVLPPHALEAAVSSGLVFAVLYDHEHSRWLKATDDISGPAVDMARRMRAMNSDLVLICPETAGQLRTSSLVNPRTEAVLEDGTVYFSLARVATEAFTEVSSIPDVDLGFTIQPEDSAKSLGHASVASLPSYPAGNSDATSDHCVASLSDSGGLTSGGDDAMTVGTCSEQETESDQEPYHGLSERVGTTEIVIPDEEVE
ncbi:Adenylate and Guanylate cyclase catalytic domain [Carpediemonas membranifera]|uniref:Adenylate and Guanylate cyclase catalytic domain n=1 Tax=Carpediemonas membranifera TaxID=201153 RepID=A0A8J6B0V1_9EUKA|nr:Adenylate and Guanylate cyclase catalytic domain [Carpediemonas membranifera]|eukprot:KAG9396015.1 Adenylate and Guanylate cyclase catalytic domain [Carpediemonas membranifera]